MGMQCQTSGVFCWPLVDTRSNGYALSDYQSVGMQ